MTSTARRDDIAVSVVGSKPAVARRTRRAPEDPPLFVETVRATGSDPVKLWQEIRAGIADMQLPEKESTTDE